MLYLLNIDFMRVLNCADVLVIYTSETEIDTEGVCKNISVLSWFGDSEFSSVCTILKLEVYPEPFSTCTIGNFTTSWSALKKEN